jgi:hypothetical protein
MISKVHLPVWQYALEASDEYSLVVIQGYALVNPGFDMVFSEKIMILAYIS